MHRESVLAFVLTLSLAVAAVAQPPEPARKQARAVRVAPGSIVVDGRTDEAAWTQIPALTDFVQKEPVEGGTPTDRMEVKFAYDDTALYVAARMWAEHGAIQSPLGRRDEGDQSEYVLVALDTYLDHRTAYGFGVTAAGVRLDRYYAIGLRLVRRHDTDPVWAAKTRTDAGGWTAEMWIPLSQLRFNRRDEQVWGLNVYRFVPSNNEWDYWVAVPRTEKVWASRFGELRGHRRASARRVASS